jgi:hypothetical protein
VVLEPLLIIRDYQQRYNGSSSPKSDYDDNLEPLLMTFSIVVWQYEDYMVGQALVKTNLTQICDEFDRAIKVGELKWWMHC